MFRPCFNFYATSRNRTCNNALGRRCYIHLTTAAHTAHLFDPEQLRDDWLVETDDEIVVDCDNWHTHLARQVDHFPLLLEIARDVVLFKSDPVLLEKLFCHFAKMTRWC